MMPNRRAQLLSAFLSWTLAVPCAPAEPAPPGFLIVVNAQNPTQSLDIKIVSRMFYKRIRRWEHEAPVVPIDLAPDSPVRKEFSEVVLGKTVKATQFYWQRQVFSGNSFPPETAGSELDVLEHVRSNAGAIAYLAADVDLGEGVKALRILGLDGVWPPKRGTRPAQGTLSTQVTQPRAVVTQPVDRPPVERRPPEQEEREPLNLILNDRGTGSHVGAVAVDPTTPAVVYAGSRRGVFKSRDYGVTWTYAGIGLEVADVHALAVDPTDGNTLYAGTHGGGVFKSLDGALSWQPARQGLGDPVVHSLAVDPHEASIVYAGTRSGIYASTDAGTTWQPLDSSGDWNPAGRSLTFYPTNPAYVTGARRSGGLVLGHAFAPAGPRFPGKFNLANKSLCGPGSTTDCLDDYGIDPKRLAVRDLKFGPGGTFYAATLYGVWRYDRAGSSWDRFPLLTNAAALAAIGSPGGRAAALERTAKSFPSARIYIGGANGIFVSDPGGNKHDELYPEPIHSLAIDPTDPWRIYAGTDEEQILRALRLGTPGAPRGYSIDPRPLPSHLRPKPSRAKSAGSKQAPRAPEPVAPRPAVHRPEKLTPTVLRLFRGIWATPATDPELRAALALELLQRVPEAYMAPVRTALASFLADLGSLDQRVRGAAFSPDSRWLVTTYLFDDGHGVHSEIRLYDLVRAVQSKSNPAGALHLEPGGLRSDLVKWRQLHDLAQESVHLRPNWVLPDPGALIAWSENGRFVATQPSYDRLAIWPVEPTAVDAPRVPRARIFPFHFLFGDSLEDGWKKGRIVALSDDGRFLAAVHRQGQETLVRLVRLISGGERVTDLHLSLPPPAGARRSGREGLLFSRDSRWLLSFGTDGAARRWDVRNPSESSPLFHEVQGPYREVLRSPDGLRVAACTDSGVLVWPLPSSGPGAVRVLPVAGGAPSRPVFSPDGRWLAVDASRDEILVWDLDADDPAAGELRIASDHRLGVFSADSQRYVLQTSGNGQPVTSWDLDVRPRRPRRTVTGSAPGADTLFEPLAEWPENLEGREMSRDGRWFVETSYQTLRLWEFEDVVPRAALAQVDRYGPVGIHGDEHAPPNGFAFNSRSRPGTSTCARIGRSLTLDEWRFFLKDEPYEPSCTTGKVTTP